MLEGPIRVKSTFAATLKGWKFSENWQRKADDHVSVLVTASEIYSISGIPRAMRTWNVQVKMSTNGGAVQET